MTPIFKYIVSWRNFRRSRYTAKRYGLDFERKCVFDHQLRPLGYPRHGGIVSVSMRSGKVGLYKASITRFWPGNTGQKDWLFEFQGYARSSEFGEYVEVSDVCVT